ncbi:MAG: hypothetical protein HGA33_05150 [Candidatus Moranbacteria bacterium]|nr:hypothetical protein [Candidatus Moranbacteria bacterium]
MKTHIKLELEIVTQREHNRLNWALREARKAAIVKAVRDSLIVQESGPEYAKAVEIGIRRDMAPEAAYIAPIVSTLRDDGWISARASVVITPSLKSGSYILFDNQ